MRERQGRDAHPARTEAAILASVLPHAPQEGSKDGSSDSGSQAKQPAGKDAHDEVCKGEGDIEHTGGLLYPPVACP
jgi:hypothetical protein